MAPKLTPDNLTLPEHYFLDVDRNLLDDLIFPLPHLSLTSGRLGIASGEFSKKYTPTPPFPSPYKDDRFITDVRVGSELDGFNGGLKYTAEQRPNGIVQKLHYLGTEGPNRRDILSVINGTKTLISDVYQTREEGRYPGDDIEIITFGTGSAMPSKTRNGTTTIERF
jgi:hypothetical protein